MVEAKKPFVSVVTPVYNAETYLAECINGVLKQTYQNFEYIIVNNCSTDRSLEIAKRYEKMDYRVRVVDSGVFRNQILNCEYSLQQVSPKAKYVKFAFADDLLMPSCLCEMVDVAEVDPNTSIVSCYVTNGMSVGHKGVRFGQSVISGKDACRLYLLQGISPLSSYNGLLFRADVIRRRTPFHNYNDGFFEDADVCFDILKIGNLGFVHQILAYNRRDNKSTISKIDSFNPLLATDLLFLHRYGNYYLTQSEFESRWNEKKRDYLKFLARSLLTGQTEEFWSFHGRAMDQMGFAFGTRNAVWNLFFIFMDNFLNPKRLVEKMIARHY